jgi:hypothetical protein
VLDITKHGNLHWEGLFTKSRKCKMATPTTPLIAQYVSALERAGWTVKLLPARRSLPSDLLARYPQLPADVRAFVESLSEAYSSDEQSWILTASDFHGDSSSAYAWNEWERQSLSAAEGDGQWMARITEFWDRHFPFLMSVKSGYAYFAIERESLAVVVGEEPEYEETQQLAPSLAEVLELIGVRDPRVTRWAWALADRES